MNAFETMDRSKYGSFETNGLVNGHEYHEAVDYSEQYSLADVKEARGRITRVRILTERMYGATMCDISYIHATLPNGKTVPVRVEVDNLTPRRNLKKAMLDWAQREGVFAKSIGLIDEGNWSIL